MSVLRNAVLHYISTMKQDDIEEYLYVNLMAHYEKVADHEELHEFIYAYGGQAEFIKDYTPDRANSSGASNV